jgi:single-strand DNA-binding protein
MANLNKVLLIGRLTRDPELRYTPQGTPVCEVSLATNRVIRNPDGTSREETCFVDITVWGKQAENTVTYCKKGRELFIEGRLTLDRWQDKETKANRQRLKVTAERVQFLSGRREEAAPATGPEEEVPPDAAPFEAAGGSGDVPF